MRTVPLQRRCDGRTRGVLRYPPVVLGLDEARALLAREVAPLAGVEVALAEGLGRRLVAAPVADADLPPSDLSAMDGYAVRATDLGGPPLPVAFVVPAGGAPEQLPRGAAARIFTGAVVPAGADTVVPQEDAEVGADGTVRLASLPMGTNVRRQGEVFAAGAALVRPGERLTAAGVAALAAGGAARLTVIPRPRVAVLVTGAELVGVAAVPRKGQVRDSNGPMLEALAGESGLAVVGAERVADDLPTLRDRLAAAARNADLVVSSGGVSVGDFDLVPRAVAELGGETVLHRVAIQPGKPILIAKLGNAWVTGLPGNPLSVLVGWRMFARPLAEALAGDPAAFAEMPLRVPLAGPARNRGARTQLRPARLESSGGVLAARVLAWKGSHDILAATPADALVRLDPGAECAAGDTVHAFPLPWRWTG